ncbi:NADH-quinone oxidoreductase subunit L [bacterium]|nr:NADH-quinone oxidoreductase subunit L [bacterium]
MDTIRGWLPYILLFPLMGMLINGILGNYFSKKWIHRIAIAAVLIPFVIMTTLFFSLQSLPEESRSVIVHIASWIEVGYLKISFSLLLDQLSAIMVMIITGIGTLIHIYSVGYMHKDSSYSRYFTYLNLFIFAMLMLVLGSNILMMFIGWEGVGLASYLLIGFYFQEDSKASAGKKAFITNRVGDFAFLIGIFILLFVVGSLDFAEIREASNTGVITGVVATIITLMFFIGATGKSAQIPLYVWLPDAMAGPTPVSALIHAATMVTAGIYMISRLHFLFILSPFTMSIIAIIGALTAFFAATIALVQTDIKKVLAYSTVSQLGYMFLAVGVGAFPAAMLHLVTHAFFKATLFLGAGSVIHAMSDEQDIMNMGGLKDKIKTTHKTFLFATIAITGVLPFSGFISKDEILWRAFATGNGVISNLPILLWIVGIITAMLTSFYMWRLYFLVFHSGQTRHQDERVIAHIHESPLSMRLALWILAGLSIVGGYIALPHFIAHSAPIIHSFQNWLDPYFSTSIENTKIVHSASMEAIFMFVSWGLALFSFFWAKKWYFKEKSITSTMWANSFKTVYNILQKKYYVDEFYYWLIDIFIIKFSHKILWRTVDFVLIDGFLIRGIIGWGTYITGRVLSIFQNGNLQFYVITMVAAIMAIFYWMIW